MSIRHFGFSTALAALLLFIPSRSWTAELVVSQYGRVTATLPWAVASEKGFFADESIKIDKIISGGGGGTTLRNMLASDLPYGEVATSAALAAIRSGLDIVIVNTASDHIGEIALVANPKGNVHKVQDLAGKKAGFTGPKSTSELLLRLALKEAGLTGKVEPVATGGFGGGLTLLDSSGIDAAPLIDPILTLQPDRYRVIFHFADLIPRMTWLVGVTTRKFAQEHPDMVRKLSPSIAAASTTSMHSTTKRSRSMRRSGSRMPRTLRPTSRNTLATRVSDRSAASIRKRSARCPTDFIDWRLQRTDRLEGRDRHSVPAQGLAKPALIKRQWYNDKGRRRKTRFCRHRFLGA
jgi:NitT/TauT family transport system substrate-binding protein